MNPSRRWYRSSSLWTLAIALAAWACGDGGGTTGPSTPEQKPVASVTVSPLTASIDVAQTQQLSATLRDAAGNTLTGRSVVWASSNEDVATVTQTGLVTGSGAGEATISATAEGRSGTAGISVTQPVPAGVVASGAIGPNGGSVGTPDVGVSIAAGQLSTSTQIQIVSSSDPMEEFGSDLVTGKFRLQGFPQDREVEVRVRLRTTAPLSEQTYIGVAVPVVESSVDTDEEQRGLVLREATDSAGYLVATVPVRGRGVQAGPSAADRSSDQGIDDLLDGLLGGVTGARSDTVPGGHFVIVSWGAPRSELTLMVSRAAKLMEDARVTVAGMGYSPDHRTQWPMEVRVYPLRPTLGGSFSQLSPFPLDVNTGYFKFNTLAFSWPEFPGVVIHEYFHFIQARYTGAMQAAQYVSNKWVKEAASTWIMEKAPETLGVVRNTFLQNQRDDLFLGMYPGLTASEGYGKAPVWKYFADQWGNDRVKLIFANLQSGEAPVDAVLKAIPEGPTTWWPDFLTKYMKGEIVSLPSDSLPQPRGETPLYPGSNTWTLGTTLRPYGGEFVRFKTKAGGYGTGTTLTVRLPSELHAAGFRMLPFRKDASDAWEERGGVADSLVIKGADLNLGREYGVYLINTTAPAPYTQSWGTKYETDLGYTDGDWHTGNVEVVNDALVYDWPSADTTKLDVVGDIPAVFSALSQGGVWKRTPENQNRYVWEPTAEFAADLASMKATASSEALVISGDSLSLKAMIDVDPPASSAGESGNPAALGGAFLFLLAGLAMRRKRQVVIVAFAGAFGLAFWGCDLSTISYSAKYRYEFRFANAALTASLEDPTVPLVQLEEGTGTFIVDRFRVEYWEYIRDEEDVIVDSIAKVGTASGQATVKLGAMLHEDGALEEDDVAGLLRVIGLQPTQSATLPEELRMRLRR